MLTDLKAHLGESGGAWIDELIKVLEQIDERLSMIEAVIEDTNDQPIALDLLVNPPAPVLAPVLVPEKAV